MRANTKPLSSPVIQIRAAIRHEIITTAPKSPQPSLQYLAVRANPNPNCARQHTAGSFRPNRSRSAEQTLIPHTRCRPRNPPGGARTRPVPNPRTSKRNKRRPPRPREATTATTPSRIRNRRGGERGKEARGHTLPLRARKRRPEKLSKPGRCLLI
jgi:hypothetical protein